jgi:DNA primase
MLSPETIQAVQQTALIEEVVGDFVSLKKKGQNLWACCPFHNERSPSFSVSPSKGFYKCFGCDAAGDAINFVQEIEGISFVEAIKYLANKYHIPIQETTTEAGEEQLQFQHEKDSLYILLKLAQEYYSHNLWQHPEGQQIGQSYLRERGFTEAIIQKFELGYSLDSWQAFYQYAQQKGYSEALLEKAGLIRHKEDKLYDYFRGRVMFPIYNVSGKVIAFGARILTSATNQPKYLNSPDTPIYHKSEALYGIYQAKVKIKQADNCYVVEGYTDVLSMQMAGIENVVAASGTAFTEAQIRLISRFTKHITILFDGDTAGISASLRGIDTILAMGLDVKVILLPTGEDPDSYARKLGEVALKQYLQEQVQDFITFKTKLLMQGAQADPVKKASVIKDVLQSIVAIPDAVTRALFIKQCSRLLDIQEAILLNEQDKLLIEREKAPHRTDKPSPSNHPKLHLTAKSGLTSPLDWSLGVQLYERENIRMLLNYGSTQLTDHKPLCQYLLEELADVEFQTPIYKQILSLYAQRLASHEAVEDTFFLQHADEAIQKTAIDLMASPYEVSDQWIERYQIHIPQEKDNLFQAAYKNILRLKLMIVHQLIEENNRTLQQAPTSEEEDRLLQVHEALKHAEMAITQQLGIVVAR